MATEVDICNLALGHLGDDANVSSLDPPEGSAQAEHCARFYPIARDSLLELHDWRFATRRKQLALVTSPHDEWLYAYPLPAEHLKTISIKYNSACQEEQVDFIQETAADGTQIILTNQEIAKMQYIALIEDTTKFSPIFVMTLSWHLASMLAGPIIKGSEGSAEGKRAQQMMASYLAQAELSDANQQHHSEFVVDAGHITARR